MAAPPGSRKSEFTRTGVRRAGDDYQHVVALDLLVEWLEHPNRYDVVRVEADDRGYLDDIAAESADRTTAIQVKFSAHPDNEDDQWDFAGLLAERDGTSTSAKLRRALQRHVHIFVREADAAMQLHDSLRQPPVRGMDANHRAAQELAVLPERLLGVLDPDLLEPVDRYKVGVTGGPQVIADLPDVLKRSQ